jgi:asparagine synthase (glutamine-hydrolysing)
LAIVDLEPRGLMPMSSADGRFHIVHNGEIYNRLELRDDLLRHGAQLLTTTDTEVILELYRRQGAQMLDLLDGMFAFAIWDSDKRELFAARDRIGEKPFYYAVHANKLYFGSEPKALFAAGIPKAFNRETWLEIVSFRGVSGERTAYQDVKTLLPGHWLRAGANTLETGEWWRFPTTGPAPSKSSFGALLEDSVRHRLIADVPVGALLSGGLDSSSVTTIAAALSDHKIPAFTVRYDGLKMDEGVYATAAAQKAGVEHHEVRVPAGERPQLLIDTAWHMDEPINFPATPEILAVSRYAKQHVRVLLTGETADELLGGYSRMRLLRYPALVGVAGRVLAPFKGRLRFGSRWYRAAASTGVSRAEWIAASYSDGDPARFTKRPLKEWAPYRLQAAEQAIGDHREPVRQAMAYERVTHLPSIVATGDRMTMAAAIEGRLSFTAKSILDFAGLARTQDFFSGPHGKQPLREAMAGRLPQIVIDRRKQGWSSPYSVYLRDDPRLRRWLTNVPKHELVAMSELGTQKAADIMAKFLDGDNAFTRDAWVLGRIVLWHQVCVEDLRDPFNLKPI